MVNKTQYRGIDDTVLRKFEHARKLVKINIVRFRVFNIKLLAARGRRQWPGD